MLERKGDIVAVADHSWRENYAATREVRPGTELITTTQKPKIANGVLVDTATNKMIAGGVKINPEQACAEFVGLVKLSACGAKMLRDICEELYKSNSERFASLRLTDLLTEIVTRGGVVETLDIHKGWIDVDTLIDYHAALAEVK